MTPERDKLPVHVGFIMDGNGRWAAKRGLPRKLGHVEGAKTFKKIARRCKDIGIKYATFYAFSTENWRRPPDEVEALMDLFRKYLKDVEEYVKDETRLIFLGDKSAFPEDLRLRMEECERVSRNFDKMTILLAMNYGGRDDITHAVKEISKMVKNGELSPDCIDESLVGSMLYTAGIPDVDLVIRPSGEQRLSNFLLWQTAYAELYFPDILWPDFSVRDFDAALKDFAGRGRRFGGV